MGEKLFAKLGSLILRKIETRSCSKELSDDYRYFPDPDLLPLILSQEEIEKIRSELPELPQQRERKYQNEFGLSSYDSKQLSVDRNKSDFFEELTGIISASQAISQLLIVIFPAI